MSNMVNKPRNYIIYLLGCIFISIGVVLMIRSSIGTSSWDSLHYSIHRLTGITIGQATAIVGLLFTVAVIIMNKSIKYLIMAAPIVLVWLMIDLFNETIFASFEPNQLIIQIIAFTLGAVLLPLGGASLIISTFPAGIFDEFNLAMMRIFKTNKLVLIRVIMELLAVATALLLGYFAGIGFGNVKIGTLIFSLIVGKELKTFLIIFERIGLYENKQIN